VSKVLVVAPHPDDETLGCGGTLLRHAASGDSVHWLIFTTINEEAGYTPERIEQRANEINEVASNYHFETATQLDFVTTRLDTYPKSDLVMAVSDVVSNIKPNTIYLPYRNDVHSDHQAVFDAVASCTKSFRYPSVRQVRAYETLSETEFSIQPNDTGFKPNLWIEIGKFVDQKIEIMKIYKGEMGEHPFPRSEKNIRALATFRGATAGVEYAEAFVSLIERNIIEN